MPKRLNNFIREDNWKPIHTKILKWVLKGSDNLVLSRRSGLDVRTIQRITSSAEFVKRQKAFENKVLDKYAEKVAERAIVDKAREKLESKALDASNKIIELAKSAKTERLQFEASKEILHIAGLKPIERQEVDIHKREYAPAEVESAKNTLEELMSITNRLNITASDFILPDAPPRINFSEDNDESKRTSEDRQETSTEEPVLPS